VKKYKERAEKRVEHLTCMPDLMKRFIVWRVSNNMANREERRNNNGFLRNTDY
jgi:hypothetical protein